MKKIKYLLFIIPLFFIFIGNSKAYVFYDGLDENDNKVYLTEENVANILLEKNPDFDYSTFHYVYCYTQVRPTYIQSLICYFTSTDTIYNSLSNTSYDMPQNITLSSGTNYGIYVVGYSSVNNKLTPTYYYRFTDQFSFTIPVYTEYPSSPSSYYGYSNFLDFTDIRNKSVKKVLDFSPYFESEKPEPETPIIENKIYLPDELQEGSCPVILNKDVIRVYDEQPTINTLVSYTDYFINSHYIKQTGDDMPTDTITCLDLDNFTTSYVYRFDFDKIIVIFVSILFLIAYPVMKIIHAFFVGFKRR